MEEGRKKEEEGRRTERCGPAEWWLPWRGHTALPVPAAHAACALWRAAQRPFVPTERGDTFPSSRGLPWLPASSPALCHASTGSPRAMCPLCRKAPSTSSFSTELLWASCRSWRCLWGE